MTEREHSPIEQLWYSWSDIGVGTSRPGFHIRAASPGLMDIYSARVRSIERYMRYVLPPGSSYQELTPDTAPVGLTFIRSDWQNECLLVHKNYLGKDGAGRPGNFFVHALALGENRNFSAREAIHQWGAALWNLNDNGLGRDNIRLSPLSLQDLEKSPTRFSPQEFRQVRFALQFVIAAYLMRRSRSIPIYIAAPADQTIKIASLIAGLTNCLPAQLVADLTFSIYEPDITRATTQIVGTSWIPTPGREQQAAATVFPKGLYREKLLINCATREMSGLQNHPQIVYNQLAADFASYAAQTLTDGQVEQLYALRDNAEQSRNSDVPLFLQMYQIELSTTSMNESEIEKYLASDLRIPWLLRRRTRENIIERALTNPEWSTARFLSLLQNLREQAQRESQAERRRSNRSDEPARNSQKGKKTGSTSADKGQTTLADALALLARDMIPEVVRYMKQAAPLPAESSERKKLVFEIILLLRLMDSSLLPQQDATGVWRQLFEAIEGSKQAISLLQSEWSILVGLLMIWHNVFPPNSQGDDRMRPLLLIPWSRLGEFLRLNLQVHHTEWVVFALEELVADPSSLTQDIAKELEQNYGREIWQLLHTLAQGRYFEIEASLLIRLIEKGYPINFIQQEAEQLLDILIREKPYQQAAQGLVITLLRVDRPGTNNYQRFVQSLMEKLLKTGPKGGQELVDVLIERNAPRVWLVDLLLASHGQNTDLQQVIQYVYPDLEMQSTFFLQNGTRYLGRQTYAQSLLKLYKQLLPQREKLQRLFLLLDSLTDTKLILDALTMTPLDISELETVLKRYGKNYLQYFRKAPELANLVVTKFGELINKGYTRSFDLLFTILPSQIEASFLEELLAAAKLNSEQQARFLEQYGPTYFAQYAQYTQESVFIDYIETYVDTLSVKSFEEKEVASFFAALASRATQLPLDTKSKERIHSWQVVREYLRAPDARPQTLQRLSNALPHVPDEPNLRGKLKQALFSSIRTSSDISEIMKSMREVPEVEEKKDEKYEFLYQLAELVAENYRSSHNLNVLLPYLTFALTLPPHERSDDFFSSFLNKLLQNIEEESIPSLRDLDAFIKLQGLPNSAMELWRMYYRKLIKPFWSDEPLITRVFKAFTKPSKDA